MAELPVIEIQPQDFSEIDQLRGSLSRGEAFSLILKHFLDDPAAVQALVTAGQTSEDKSPAAIDFEQSFQDLEAMMDDPDLDPPGPGTDTGDFPGLQSDAGQLEVDDFPGLPGAQDQTGEDDFPGVPYTQGQTAEDDFPGLPQSQADTEDFTAPTEGPCAADDDDFPG
ncbi:MAG: hypothetical protein ABJN42_22565, partial [Roseibium sp.]|uniref:hypothetical protein n=1 Tax=Roseibium sp. TaxID=1936156 RepID=UPI003297FC32